MVIAEANEGGVVGGVDVHDDPATLKETQVIRPMFPSGGLWVQQWV